MTQKRFLFILEYTDLFRFTTFVSTKSECYGNSFSNSSQSTPARNRFHIFRGASQVTFEAKMNTSPRLGLVFDLLSQIHAFFHCALQRPPLCKLPFQLLDQLDLNPLILQLDASS